MSRDTILNERGETISIAMNRKTIELPDYRQAGPRKKGEIDVEIPVMVLKSQSGVRALPTPFGYKVVSFSAGESYTENPVKFTGIYRDDLGITYIHGLENAYEVSYRLAKSEDPIRTELADKFTHSFDPNVPLSPEDEFYEQMLGAAKTTGEKVTIIRNYMQSSDALATTDLAILRFLRKTPNFFQVMKTIGIKGACSELNTYLANELRRHGIPALLTHDLSFAKDPNTKEDSVMVDPKHVRVVYFDESNAAHMIDAVDFVKHDANYNEGASRDKRENLINPEILGELEKAIEKSNPDPILGLSAEDISSILKSRPEGGGQAPPFKDEENNADATYKRLFELQRAKIAWPTVIKTGNLKEILRTLNILFRGSSKYFIERVEKYLNPDGNRAVAKLIYTTHAN